MSIDVKIKLLPGGQMPRRMTPDAAGWDCCANIQAVRRVYSETSVSLPLGFEMELPRGWMAHVAPRSGLAFNHDVVGYFGTIDPDYRGEVRALLFNHGGRWYDVKPGERVCQLVFHRVEEVRLFEADALGETERGRKGYGSTGRYDYKYGACLCGQPLSSDGRCLLCSAGV